MLLLLLLQSTDNKGEKSFKPDRLLSATHDPSELRFEPPLVFLSGDLGLRTLQFLELEAAERLGTRRDWLSEAEESNPDCMRQLSSGGPSLTAKAFRSGVRNWINDEELDPDSPE
mmetsp:Transcript_18565/g.26699  ORF Transcript_18565/g.26699 Transcript_18565/m.26699 type:complete len:115 (+) Transcript_18565:692-1036(+)